ncbi:salicylate hydroxylase [Colletotrichum sojae]|uniref:Salicylate hydroxylase n=1 Tax=Colletotrichum sojae TaxID=2175907 RepID=A0A8H6N3S4_9PEZI|nr:salicylate hydroxylase [Colletotrichum sojae]
MTSPAPKTVGIIGAAVAGPTLALHLLTHPVLRARFRPILFDQSPPPAGSTPSSSFSSEESRQRAGASVGLFSNGLHPLLSLNLGDAIKKHGHECDDLALWSSSNSSGTTLTHHKTIRNAFWSHDLQLGTTYFERAGLQALLVERVHRLGGEVRWSKKAVTFEPVASGQQTRVTFEDGSHIDVDLLVGADGGYSPVRRHVLALRDSTNAEERWLPHSMNATGIYGISSADLLPEKHAPERPFTESQCIFLPEGFLATGPCPGRMFRWDLILPESAAAEDPESSRLAKEANEDAADEPWQASIVPGPYPKSTTARILRSHRALKHPFSGDFATMLRTSDRIIHTPLRQRVWREDEIQHSGGGNGNIVLIGDAARLMLPTSGQGTGFAIEDATVLASMLLKHSAGASEDDAGFREALEEYARVRRPRSDRMANVASWVGSVGLGATWYYKLMRYGSAVFTSGADLK